MTKYANEELLEYMRQFYKENGRRPLVEDFTNNKKYPGFATYYRQFGTWKEALKMAGLNSSTRINIKHTDEQLIDCIKKFYTENNRPPVQDDFLHNQDYPSFQTYVLRFGSWANALKLSELDVNSMVEKGVNETNQQKARNFEIKVNEHFKKESTDLSGENQNSPYDGICPIGQIYDAKSSKLYQRKSSKYWQIHFQNKQKDLIQWYYIGLFNNDYSKLMYVLRVPTYDIIKYIRKGLLYLSLINISNWNKYNITDKFQFDDTEKN